jgi:nitrate/nitrite transport system permease protein
MKATSTPLEGAPARTADAPTNRGPRFPVHRVTQRLDQLGLPFFIPYARLLAGFETKKQVAEIARGVLAPGVAILLFLGFWSVCAKVVRTDSVAIPSPAETWFAWLGMREFAAMNAAKEDAHNEKQRKLSTALSLQAEKAAAAGNTANAETFRTRAEEALSNRYAGSPTFGDQIAVSLLTVLIGFAAATAIAIPLGLLCGLSPLINTAIMPLIQVFKPVSPLAWLPIVFVFVTALYQPAEDAKLFGRALFISAGTVTLCSLWPTLINTAFGAASVQQDFLNVGKVLRLNWRQRIWRIVMPSSLPFIFTGLRLSLGVGWMVLIAADMLAQNPGLGKFIWDEFQNGSSESMGRIVVAVIVIGIIGFLLDRSMHTLQRLVTADNTTA